MALFSRNNQQNLGLQSKIQQYIEKYGMTAEEVMKRIEADTMQELVEKEDRERYGIPKQEEFPEEIKIISQALAYREANREEDLEEISALLNQAYQEEIHGDEAFRLGPVAITKEIVDQYLQDESYHWLLAEAPNGYQVGKDGFILGVVCFSTDGVSKRNGVVEGHVASIRFFGILTRFRGLCIGQRLLAKVEDIIFQKYQCVRSMVCLPSCRRSMISWIEKRQYHRVVELPYPFQGLHHQPLNESSQAVSLVQYLKWNPYQSEKKEQIIPDKSSNAMPAQNPESHLPPIFRKKLPVLSEMIYENENENEQLVESETEILGVD